jgi:hypothetical protein
MSTQEKIQSLVHQMDEANDILKASESSLAFWDTPEDEIWDKLERGRAGV